MAKVIFPRLTFIVTGVLTDPTVMLLDEQGNALYEPYVHEVKENTAPQTVTRTWRIQNTDDQTGTITAVDWVRSSETKVTAVFLDTPVALPASGYVDVDVEYTLGSLVEGDDFYVEGTGNVNE